MIFLVFPRFSRQVSEEFVRAVWHTLLGPIPWNRNVSVGDYQTVQYSQRYLFALPFESDRAADRLVRVSITQSNFPQPPGQNNDQPHSCCSLFHVFLGMIETHRSSIVSPDQNAASRSLKSSIVPPPYERLEGLAHSLVGGPSTSQALVGRTNRGRQPNTAPLGRADIHHVGDPFRIGSLRSTIASEVGRHSLRSLP
jgi:hypothetical protein